MSWLQFLSMGVIVIALGVEVWWIFTHKHEWLVAVPNVSWLAHSLIFYICLWYHSPYQMEMFADWSMSVRLHGFLTVLMMGLYRMNGRISRIYNGITLWIRRHTKWIWH